MRYFGAVFALFIVTACAYAQGADDYLEKLKTVREGLASATEDASLAREASERLAELENISVSTPEGEVVIIRNRWAGIMANEIVMDSTDTSLRRALDKVGSIERQVKQYESGSAKPIDIELASGDEFGDGASKPELGDVNLGIRERLNRLAR